MKDSVKVKVEKVCFLGAFDAPMTLSYLHLFELLVIMKNKF